jgi:serine/threonine protein kinase
MWRKNGGSSRSYSPVVDIWSLGVVAFECLSGVLPRSSARGTDWCKDIVEDILMKAPSHHHSLHHLLLSHMVVMNPKVRGSAQECYDEVVLLKTAQKPSSETSAGFSLESSPGSSLQEDRQSALANISNTPRQSVTTGADYDKRCLLPNLRPLPGLRPINGLRPLPPILIDEHVILQTVEHDSESEDAAAGPRVSTRSPDDRSGATTRTFPSSPTASRRRTSEYPASATITPKRIARPSHSPSLSGRQHVTGHNSTRRGSASTHTRGSSRHLVLPEDFFSEEEGADSGYLATNALLDPLVVGSEVAMLGRECASSFGRAQTGSRSVPRSVPQSVPRSGADKSSVVLRDDWLYKPLSKD